MPVDQFHVLQFKWAGVVVALALIGYYFAPPDKAQVLVGFGTTAMGFMFGKFTNGFNRRKEQEEQANAEEDAELGKVARAGRAITHARRGVRE